MLSYKYRFHGHGSLRFVYSNGQAVRTRILTLKWIRNPRRRSPRVAVVVSKKTLKSAVGRNRIRRRLYESLRRRLDKIDPSTDMVIIVSSSELRTMAADELEQLVDQLLTGAQFYKTP